MDTERKITFFIKPDVQKAPQLSLDEKFYIIYSPMKFNFRPCKSIFLNLRLKIKLPDSVQSIIGFSPSLILQKLTIENFKRLTPGMQDEFIKVDLPNRNFHDTVKIKKNQRIAGLILFETSYKYLQ